jgi:FkbM family methyltransferase
MVTGQFMRKITIRNKNFNVKDAHCDFWNQFEKETWEKTTLDIFDANIHANSCFLDIGSWMGPTALYAAQSAKHVICIEADPIAYQELQENIDLNPSLRQKITTINKAISPTEENVRMGARHTQGDSMSSIIFSSDTNFWEISSITPQQIFSNIIGRYDHYFIKIDIEGGEYSLMPHLRKLTELPNNIFFISLHPKFVERNSFLRFFKMSLQTRKALLPFKSYKISLVDNHSVSYSPIISGLVKMGLCFLPLKRSLLIQKIKP